MFEQIKSVFSIILMICILIIIIGIALYCIKQFNNYKKSELYLERKEILKNMGVSIVIGLVIVVFYLIFTF